MSDDKAAVQCPHCGGALRASVVADLQRESALTFRIVPAEGAMLDVSTLGGTLSAFRDLLCAASMRSGITTDVLVRRIITDEAGAIEVEMLIARVRAEGGE